MSRQNGRSGPSGASNISALEVVRDLRAQVVRLKAELRDARSTIASMQEAASIGHEVMARFPDRQAFDAAMRGAR